MPALSLICSKKPAPDTSCICACVQVLLLGQVKVGFDTGDVMCRKRVFFTRNQPLAHMFIGFIAIKISHFMANKALEFTKFLFV